jgi:hypothetical protein
MSYIGNVPINTAFQVDTFSGNGSTTAFTMSVAPANTSSILVVVTGVTQDPSTYSVSGTTLTFSAAPPSGTNNISVRYLGIPASGVTTTAYRTVTNFTATAGQTSFTTPSYTVGYINVFRNGVYLPTTDYTATTGTTVVLNNAANAGDTITTESFYVSSVLNAIPATAASISQSYLAGNVGATGPAFSVYKSAASQTVTTSVWTKITFDVKDYDTNNNFASSTFTPTVAGYYQISGGADIGANSGTLTRAVCGVYKNGSLFKALGGLWNFTGTEVSTQGSVLVYCNGSTDYIELWGLAIGTSPIISNGSTFTYFTGALVRAA